MALEPDRTTPPTRRRKNGTMEPSEDGSKGRGGAAEALRLSEARKSAMLEVSLDAVISMDHEGRIIEWNRAAETMFGYRREQVLGETMADLIIPERLRELHRDGLERYLRTGQGPVLGKRIEMPALKRDGSEFPVELAIARIPMPGPPTFMAVLRDISGRKLAEKQLVEREALIVELSTPVLRLGDRLLLLPLVGMITPQRATRLNGELLKAAAAHRARVVILDLTGVAGLDAQVAEGLMNSINACRLLGAVVILTGLSSDCTASLVSIGTDVSRLIIKGDLQGGVEEARRLLEGRHPEPARR